VGPPASFGRAYGITLLLCALLLLLGLQPQAGLVVFAFGVPWLAYTPHNLARAFKQPRQRKWRLTRFTAWAVCFGIVLTVHESYQAEARAEATRFSARIIAFKEKNGRYPKNMAEAGVESRRDLPASHAYYVLRQGQPTLLYHDTWRPNATHWFNFEALRWDARQAGR